MGGRGLSRWSVWLRVVVEEEEEGAKEMSL